MIHESIIRNLILEEMKRDPLFRQYVVNEGLGDLWKAITKRVRSFIWSQVRADFSICP